MTQKLSYCGDVVRQHDPDRFLLSMFAPAAAREDLWALFAFNHEIARTREVVSETQLGLIRLQWWRDAIASIYDGEEIPDHEIVKPLANAIKVHDLTREYFETLIYAREFDLEDVLPANLEGLLNYADFTTTPLMKLAVRVMGGDPEMEVVQPVAVNYALPGLLRAIPFHVQQRRCVLPEDLLAQNKVSTGKLYDLKPQEGLPEVVKAIAGEIIPGIKTSSRFLRASDVLAQMYASQIKRLNYDVFHPKMSVPPAFRELRLMMRAGFM